MLGLLNFRDPIQMLQNLLVFIPTTFLALTVHEFAHGWVSSKLGDPTPRIEGRITLNPFAHIDIIGTLMMIITGFGWAKPVPINPAYYKNRKAGTALVAAAGPLSNFFLAFIAVLIWGIFILLQYVGLISDGIFRGISVFCQLFAIRNIGFMVFNIIPIPPLDGWNILAMFVPDRICYTVTRYQRYCMLFIMVLSLSGALGNILYFGYNGVYRILTGIVGFLINAVMRLL